MIDRLLWTTPRKADNHQRDARNHHARTEHAKGTSSAGLGTDDHAADSDKCSDHEFQHE